MLLPISLLRNWVVTMLILFLFPGGTLPDLYVMFITRLDRKRPKPQCQSGGTELFMLKRTSIPLGSFITRGKILPKPFLWYQMAMLVPCHWGLLSNVPIQVSCFPWTSVKGLHSFWIETQDIYSSSEGDRDKTLAMLRCRLEKQKSSGEQKEYPKQNIPKEPRRRAMRFPDTWFKMRFLRRQEWVAGA